MMQRTLIPVILILSINGAVYSQNGGFDILTIGPNTKALGYNEAVSAQLLGASNLYSNPANLNFEPSSSINADYTLWIAGLRNTHFAAHFKRDHSSFAFGLLASEADDFELRNRPGPSQGGFTVSYLSIGGAYAYRIGNISAGITFQYLHEELYIYNAGGYALNGGISSQWMEGRLRISAAVQNMGSIDKLNTEGTELPEMIRGGFEAKLFNVVPPKHKDLPISVSLASDYVYLLHTVTPAALKGYLNIGLNVNVSGTIDVRAGYKTGETDRPFSFGTGITLNDLTANYAFIPFQTGFGTVHSIGLQYGF